MKPAQSDLKSMQTYHLGFVVVLVILFVFVLLMTMKQWTLGSFEENFFQRVFLIENFNRLRLKLGDRVINDVLVGKDGWMDFTGGGNLNDYQNAIPFSQAKLEAAAVAIDACYQYAREHDITFLVVVTPNKASIYPDKLPEQIQPLSDRSRLDQLNEYLKEHDIPQILDLRPALRAARQQHDVYYIRGSHWTRYGAYVAYETIIQTLSQSYPELVPYSAKFFRFRPIAGDKASTPGDIARLIQANYLVLEPALFPTRDTDDFFNEINFPIPGENNRYHRVTWIANSDLPSLVMFHDSFGNAGLNDYLALNFSKAYYIPRDSMRAFLSRHALEYFAPDVLIYQVVERNLHALPSQLSGCPGK